MRGHAWWSHPRGPAAALPPVPGLTCAMMLPQAGSVTLLSPKLWMLKAPMRSAVAPAAPRAQSAASRTWGPPMAESRWAERNGRAPERGPGVRHTERLLCAPALGDRQGPVIQRSKGHPSPASPPLPSGVLGFPRPFYSLGKQAPTEGPHPHPGSWSAQSPDSPGMWMGRYLRLRTKVGDPGWGCVCGNALGLVGQGL